MWTSVFADEFTGSVLDTVNWQTKYPNWPRFTSQNPGGDRTNTNDASYYADDHVSVVGGSCVLSSELLTTVSGLSYTSGMIMSMPDGGGGWQGTYGYFESRLRIPNLYTGIWPAFWLSCSNYNQWPPEIDIMEHFGSGNGYEANDYYSGGNDLSGTIQTGVSVADWHVYGCEWVQSAITWYLDGSQVHSVARAISDPQYVILDLAAYDPQSPSFSSATMEIDYMRIWQ